MKQDRFEEKLRRVLHELDAVGLLRRSAPSEDIRFVSNDYLGFGAAPPPSAPSSARGSRLVTGDSVWHRSVEHRFASWFGADAGLAFTSGYAANVGSIGALAGQGDLIVSDELNHASIIDGARLARARVAVTKHLDVQDVERALRGRSEVDALVVVESYYSMDADGPDLAALRAVCDEHRASLYVDEAHAAGTLGPGGRGRCTEAGIRPDVAVVTLGKAFGSQGALVLGSAALRDFLLNRARSFVFSTGLAPSSCSAAIAALEALTDEPDLLERLQRNADRLRDRLRDGLGEGTVLGFGPIVPVIVGSSSDALRASTLLRERGFSVPAIRPPTVPEGAARLRFTVSASTSADDIDALASSAVDAVRSVSSKRRSAPVEVELPSAMSPSNLWLVAGTGTGIGKTFLTATLAREVQGLLGSLKTVAAIKPVETGTDPVAADVEELAAASTFHVKHSPYLFRRPVSPHLAARDEGASIELKPIVDWTRDVQANAGIVLLETAGGLFSPLNDDRETNAELARALNPVGIVLVAPDRLGVLHDVGAVVRAARDLPIKVIALVAPATPDASTGTNASSLRDLFRLPVVAVPRGAPSDEPVREAARAILGELAVDA